jgi:hypothetical protein
MSVTDHQRGCEGRAYTCTCGYDDRLEARAEAAEARVARLREVLRYMADTALIDDDYRTMARTALEEPSQ